MLQLEHPLDFLRIQLERVALSEFQAQSMWITPPVPFVTQNVYHIYKFFSTVLYMKM
jgi:hypothetical protein